MDAVFFITLYFICQVIWIRHSFVDFRRALRNRDSASGLKRIQAKVEQTFRNNFQTDFGIAGKNSCL